MRCASDLDEAAGDEKEVGGRDRRLAGGGRWGQTLWKTLGFWGSDPKSWPELKGQTPNLAVPQKLT